MTLPDLAWAAPAAPLADTPSNTFSVGMLAFAAFVFLVVALWLLMRNMNARIRRMSYSERDRQEERSGAQVGSVGSEPGDTGSTAPQDAAAEDGAAKGGAAEGGMTQDGATQDRS